MPLIMSFLAAAVGLILAMNLSSQYVSSRTTSKKSEVLALRSETMREVGSAVRTAYDVYWWQQANGQTNCPSGTRLLNSAGGGVQLCWHAADDGCLKINDWNVCPYQPNWAIRAPINTFDIILGLISKSAWAVPVPLTPLTPQSAGLAEDSVEVAMPACGNPDTTTCIQCTDSRTTCWTMNFCVEKNATTCSANRVISQTFAVRRF